MLLFGNTSLSGSPGLCCWSLLLFFCFLGLEDDDEAADEADAEAAVGAMVSGASTEDDEGESPADMQLSPCSVARGSPGCLTIFLASLFCFLIIFLNRTFFCPSSSTASGLIPASRQRS